MRPLACLVALLACLVAPGAARSSGLTLRPVGTVVPTATASTVPVGVVVDARADVAAFSPAAGQLTVAGDGGASRVYAIPSGCVPSAVAPGVAALTCETPLGRVPTVLSLASGATTAVPFADDLAGFATITGLGTRWLQVEQGSYAPDGNPSAFFHAELIDLASGRHVSLAGRGYGPAGYPDLDAAHPSRALCRPLQRTADPGYGVELGEGDAYLPIDVVGRWALQSVAGGASELLEHCGTAKTTHFADGKGVVLGATATAYVHDRTIVVRLLRTGRALTVAWPSASRPALALTAGRLYVTAAGTTPGSAQTWVARLPAGA
jgi:hypothetical protein